MFLFQKAGIRTLLIIFISFRVVKIPAIMVLGYWIFIQVLSGMAEFGSRSGAGMAWFAHMKAKQADHVLET
jgi:membrane associated rhomboid family serine protease